MDVKKLQVGDLVMGFEGYAAAPLKLTVTRKTATQAVLSNGWRLTGYGRIVGKGTWSRAHVTKWDGGRYAEMHRRATVARLARQVDAVTRYQWEGLCLETLQEVLACVRRERRQ